MNTFLFFFLQISGEGGIHQIIKDKFVEGNVLFMSLVAIALILGLAFCIERIIYLTLSEINARKFVAELAEFISAGNIDGAKDKARNTVGPVASICYQGLLRMNDPIEDIDRSMESYANVQLSLLEKGSAWIKLFIAIAPSLGFLGTVIGMVMAFERIEIAGDISPTIVAEGMKVALLTTIFGIVAAVVLQLFYNYILTKIDRITMQMEESAISLLDVIGRYKHSKGETS
ncbi:MAG: MotA/TolQ/ExbB proton channel family protein [Prevotella sp.]|nr:MotA/TolQ/ExbB proton channel family protein [Prevotella sp.]